MLYPAATIFRTMLLCAMALTFGHACANNPFKATEVASFDQPWAMTFLPDGRLLVTEKPGRLLLVTQQGQSVPVSGVPEVAYGGQGGFGDVVLHPDFASNSWIYLSYAESGTERRKGATVVRAMLSGIDTNKPSLKDLKVIWRQTPKVTGSGHFGHRLAFSADGHLYISSGERQKFTPSQDMAQNLGKIIRLKPDGTIPEDNPFAKQGGVASEVWSLGHRNPLGMAFDPNGQLWNHEMGPSGGDELNRVERGLNYGYPIVSNGDHYGGRDIPDHDTRPEFAAPAITWTPVISPAGLIFYTGNLFTDWQNNALIGGLSARALVRVQIENGSASEAQRYPMGARIREVEQGPGGAVWVLEDGSGGRLLKLMPSN